MNIQTDFGPNNYTWAPYLGHDSKVRFFPKNVKFKKHQKTSQDEFYDLNEYHHVNLHLFSYQKMQTDFKTMILKPFSPYRPGYIKLLIGGLHI